MTFIEALAEYHKGKKIFRKVWDSGSYSKEADEWLKTKPNLYLEFIKLDRGLSRMDLFADDWIAEEK